MSSTSQAAPAPKTGSVHFGVKALGLALGFSRLVRLGTTVVLVRILTKADFGLVTLATAAIFALSAFREVGFSRALVHRSDNGEEDLALAADTAFWVLAAANLALFTFGWLATPWLASWFTDMAGVEPVLRAMMLLFLFDGLAATPVALLERRLQFGVISVADGVSVLVFAATAIMLALAGMGVWSLVAGHILSRLVQVAWVLRGAGWKPRARFDWPIAKELFDYGKWLWASAGLQVISRSADKLVMGRVAGGAVLGVYGVAFRLCTAPAQPVNGVINRVAFPALSQKKDRLHEIAADYKRALAMICLVAFPAAAGLALVADEFVVTLYTREWQDMVPLIRVLAFYGMTLTVGTITGPVLMAVGKPKIVTFVGAGRQLALLTLLLTIGSGGALHVAWAVLIPVVGSAVVGHILAARAVGLPLRDMLVPQLRTGVATVVMLAAVYGVEAACESLSPAGRLAVCITTGAVTYLAACRLLVPDIFGELTGHARKVLLSKGRAR